MIADYHIHTVLCRHAEGEPRAYVDRACALGMVEMGFADHLPLLGDWRPSADVPDDLAMRRDELDGYVALVQDLAREYRDDARILLGIEADYIAATLDETAAVLQEYPFEYVIGSVHTLGDGLVFDHSALRGRLRERGVDGVYVESYGLVAKAAATGLFTTIGHFDLAKKFGDRPRDGVAVAAAASAALRAVAAAGTALELNTAGWRKPVAEAYPAPNLLAEAARLGIPLVFGSDAHAPGEVGQDFGRAAAVAREAGYAALLQLSTGRRQELV